VSKVHECDCRKRRVWEEQLEEAAEEGKEEDQQPEEQYGEIEG